MVRRIKALAAASGALLDGLRQGLSSAPQAPEDDGVQPIDVLVRNALQNDLPAEADVSRVWAELSSRVLGPFGMLALEGPVFAYSDGPRLQSPVQSREGSELSVDHSAPLPYAEVHSAAVFRGSDCHLMNLR
ncbi:MAG TPA: hypothetical protein VJ183_02625 [Chloroflexia bacterium]|nr:hypothetical protein [Chloroflexia bacterium]